MRRHDIRFPLRGRVWAAVPFFCACLCVESGLPSRFFCACPCVESGLPCGASPADSGWNIRSVRGGMSGRRGGRNVRSAGAACTARRRAMRRRCRGREAERPGPLTETPGDGPGRDLPPEVPAGHGRGKDSGKRAASAAVRCRQRIGSGGRRIPASEGKQKAVFVRKPLLSYDRMRYSLSGVTLT